MRIVLATISILQVCVGAAGWTTKTTALRTKHSVATRSSLHNVPPPSQVDTEAFKEYSSRQSPPASFFDLQQACISSTKLAINDGHQLLEVEFPPLPAKVLELDDVSAYEVSQATLKLAVEFARGFLVSAASEDDKKACSTIKNIGIMFPDESESRIATEYLTGKEDANPITKVEAGITISSLRRSEKGDDRLVKPEQLLLSLFGGGSQGAVKAMDNIDMYICLVASAQELPDIEELYGLVKDKNIPIIFYNLKLDVLRGDLGAPAFPPKAFQDRFLSLVKPVYYLRTRQYSRSIPTPPFLVNYQGCLFRAYPGQYQTLLDTGTGSYRRLLGQDRRPALGEFKEQLTQALRDEGVLPKTEGQAFDFLRRGYKTTTWWEEEREDASDAWLT